MRKTMILGRLKRMLSFLVLCFTFFFAGDLSAQEENFILEYYFPNGSTNIRIGGYTSGLVDYTWTARPSGKSGEGSFRHGLFSSFIFTHRIDISIDASPGDTVELNMEPQNLRRFYHHAWGSSHSSIVNVKNWGNVPWTSMDRAFSGASQLTQITATDQPDLSGVIYLGFMFNGCTNLDEIPGIESWDVSKVTNMASLFRNARAFNQDISQWNVSKVISMNAMLEWTRGFNHNIGNWKLNPNVDMEQMLNASGLDCDTYSRVLIDWQRNNPTVRGRNLGALGMRYTEIAKDAREKLVNNQNWNIQGDLLWEDDCEDIFSFDKDDFVVEYTQGSGLGDTIITLHIESDGEVEYSWMAYPSFSNGAGSFTPDANDLVQLDDLGIIPGDVVVLSLKPKNLKRFYQTSISNKTLTGVLNWGIAEWSSMEKAFYGCMELEEITADDIPDLSRVESIKEMFAYCRSLAHIENIENWDTENVSNMREVFYSTESFNGDISSWNTSNVTSMYGMLWNTKSFSRDLSQWDVSKVEDMGWMFFSAAGFNESLGEWRLHPNVSMSFMLTNSGIDCDNYSSTLIGWQKNNPDVTNRRLYASGLGYGPHAESAREKLRNEQGWTIIDDQLSEDCEYVPEEENEEDLFIVEWLFPESASSIRFSAETDGEVHYTWTADPSGNEGEGSFTQSSAGSVTLTDLKIEAEDIVTIKMEPEHLKRFFTGSDHKFIYRILNWGAVRWSSMEYAFKNGIDLEMSAEDVPDLTEVTSMAYMFDSCHAMLGNRGNWEWNTSSVKDMSHTFSFATNFNGDISSWNVSRVEDMEWLFAGALAFNQNIGNWNVSNVKNMLGIFGFAVSFNRDIGSWDVSRVENMSGAFGAAVKFNQNIGNWNVSNVENMESMFEGANDFNYSLGNWDLGRVSNMNKMLNSSGLSVESYDNTLIRWAASPSTPQDIQLGASKLLYCASQEARQSLIDDLGWEISGDALAGDCEQIPEEPEDADLFTLEWTFPESASSISFSAETDGEVHYTWTADPSGNEGEGSFYQSSAGSVTLTNLDITAGDKLTISMQPEHLKRFFTGEDHDKITEVLNWGIVEWISMESAFEGAGNLLQISTPTPPDLSQTSSMEAMFLGCVQLNEIQGVEAWNTSEVTDMSAMFWGAESFNRNLNSWNTGKVKNMQGMFRNARAFNQNLNAWDTRQVEDMSQMFYNATTFNGDISDWNTGKVKDFSWMFFNAVNFNRDIGNWNTESAKNMGEMFYQAASFNRDLSGWNTSEVIEIGAMFRGATAFNGNISDWEVSKITDMRHLFDGASSFDQNLNGWDTKNVTNMSYTFANTSKFNGNISSWETGQVTDMSFMFFNAPVFNGDPGNWNTNNVTDMTGMFSDASAFNHDIGNWSTGQVKSMNGMFSNAASFNRDISNWDTKNVEDMSRMFSDAASFNQDLGQWSLNPDVDLSFMLTRSGMDCDHYTATLVG